MTLVQKCESEVKIPKFNTSSRVKLNQRKNEENSSDNTFLDSQIKNNELKTRMPNIKVFSGNLALVMKLNNIEIKA